MGKIEGLQRQQNKVEKRLWHESAFIRELGDPSQWRFNGNVYDLGKPVGKCICGHSIQFQFQIEHQGKQRFVGSECINYFEFINPTMFNALKQADEKLKKDIAEAKKKARELELNEQIVPLKAEYDELRHLISARVKDLRSKRVYVDYELYSFYAYHKTKEFVRLGSYLKYLQKEIEYLKSLKEKMIQKYGL